MAKRKINTNKKYKRESTRRSNREIAIEVQAGKYGENWEFVIKQLGYSVEAIKTLLR